MNGEIVPKWGFSGRQSRLFKTKAHADAIRNIGETLASSKTKNAKIMNGLERDALFERNADRQPLAAYNDAEVVRNWLVTPEQSKALEDSQKLIKEIARLGNMLNQQNVVFSLGLPVLQLSEAARQLEAIDEKIARAAYSGRKMKVNPVSDDLKAA
ncbi:hypothetical protein [Neisseria mucosa]|uniref:hypothetical protein n=1 Tax=Neisseria mucosa TaxID=488 RepID=UPI001878F25E|nr:hypothetical protein [Neisseria mucosa]